jgi:predicted ATP-binding protein involved in virulence
MRINKIFIKNFKCFDEVELDFDPHLNVFVGVNGSGKTTVLSALRIASGSFFLGLSQQVEKQIGIGGNDVRIVNFESNFESKLPVILTTHGVVNGKLGSWKREKQKQTLYAKTHYREALFIKKEAQHLEDLIVQNGKDIQLPLIAYYGTERLNTETKATQSIEIKGSRLRGYFNALQFYSNRKEFAKWFGQQELARVQSIQRRENKSFDHLELVRRCLIDCIPDCADIYADFNTDKMTITFKDGSRQPFDNLSDGVLIMLTLVSDLAYRSVLLNPNMGMSANHTEGVVLIDEIELHLHPSWQRHVISDLRKVFPNIQFFITTHSPQIVSIVPRESLFVLKDAVKDGQNIKEIEKGNTFTEGRDSNALLGDVFGIDKRPLKFAHQLGMFYKYLEEENLIAAEAIFGQLKDLWGENDTDILRANLYLKDLQNELAV